MAGKSLVQLKENPTVDEEGAVVMSAGRFARESVLAAFEMIGGVKAMAQWAEKNPTEFYTKLYAKTITREVETHDTRDVDNLIAELDQRTRNITPDRGDG